MNEASQLLIAIEQGDPQAPSQLLPLVYDELRRLAAQKLAHEPAGQTLQPTALVHEAYLRLAGDGDYRWDSRGHFFAACAEAMRRILIDNARRRSAQKRGGTAQRLQIDDQLAVADRQDDEVLALDEALDELEKHDAQVAQLVKLRYFSGLSHQDSAEVLGISRRSADRLWAVAKAWLHQRMHQG
jgi:RNA polymerase sigma factor (TIGR02999 family)